MNAILLVDADVLTLRVLDLHLRKAGYAVTTATDGAEALEKTRTALPDLVVTATRLREVDGFSLLERLRDRAGSSELPAIFLVRDDADEDRVRAEALGSADVLTKPVFVRELLAIAQIALARRVQRAVTEERPSGAMRLSGTTADLVLVDLLQSLETSRSSGLVHLEHGGDEARIYLRDGNVVDAELGRSRGADVVYRALAWDAASFRVELRPVDNDNLLECSTQALLMRALDRLGDAAPATPEVPAAASAATPAVREVSPSTAPWTSDAAPGADAALAPAGLPHAKIQRARRVAFFAVAASAALVVAGAVQSARSHRGAEVSAQVRPSTAAAVGAQAETPARPGAPHLDSEPSPVPPTTGAAPEATPPTGAAGDVMATAPAASAPAAPVETREKALDVRTDLHAKSPLVRDADRALLKGDTARAVSLAQQAVASNPVDADGWLTLAAARRASGDAAGARDAYRRCVANARTFGVMSCRALVGRAD